MNTSFAAKRASRLAFLPSLFFCSFLAAISIDASARETLGPSSRTTPIAISEIMYKPAARTDGKNLEFIEIYNSNPWFQDIGGYKITCADMNYTFPVGTMIGSNSFIVVAGAPADITSVYGITNVMGPYTGSLKKTETLQLLDERTNVLLTVPFSNIHPWPIAAAGEGHSIVLANPSYGEGDPRAWDISDVVGGSPGRADVFTSGALRNVVINEILPHSENPATQQFIELYNHSAGSVDISGCILTDDVTTNRFVISSGTILGPGGFVSFTQSQTGFQLNGTGGTLYFIQADKSRVLDAVQYGGQTDGVSYGRWPDGANDFYAFTTNTPGTNNSSIWIGDIVIDELMYDPISGNDDDQFIELYNKGTNTVNLAGWQFSAGVTFTFPNVTIAPNGYLVVARNITNLLAKYPNLNSANTVGNYSGKLSHSGELVALAMPQKLNGTTTILVEQDEVTYRSGGRWGKWSAGGGSSLELIDPQANHRLASNWADSDETQKSTWTNIETTGVLDNGANYESGILHAQIGLLDEGECLVDNLEVNLSTTNYVSNGTFETGTNNWSFQGAYSRSSLENVGYAGSRSLHIRADDGLFTGVNSCQVSLNTNGLASGQTVTMRFKAKWLHGWPEALFRLNGNWLEAVGQLALPTNLGSPGMVNSRHVANAGPAIYNVTHTPTLPAASQPIVVTAQVHDPNAVTNMTLFFRVDPATSYAAVMMRDDGLGGDTIAKDGIYSAIIPGQTANRVVAFYISATDGASVSNRFPAVAITNAPVPECVVCFGDNHDGGIFGVYHLWITQTNINRWSALSDLSNEGNECTFVNGSRVIYNMQARFAGSPYHQNFDTPVGNLCHYKFDFNDDDEFLGAKNFNKIHTPGNGAGDDSSLQREQLAHTLLRALGVPWLNRRYIALYANGTRRGSVMEDAQTPGNDVVNEHWPNDPDGFLYKMQPWFEMAPFPLGNSIGFNNYSWCNLMPYTTTGGVKKIARYRFNFETRRTPNSANNFTNVFSLIDAANANTSPNYIANLENMADMDNWMRVFAANHAAGNWDSVGAQNGQNLYGYIGTLGTKYSLLMWDFNIVFGSSGSWGPGENLFGLNGQDSNMTAIYNTPKFRRMYWEALQELVNGPLNTLNSGPMLDAKYNAFVSYGLSPENPSTNIKPWLNSARISIASQLAAVNALTFSVNSNVAVTNNLAYVTGTAPVNVTTIWINGAAYPVKWTTLTNWVVTIPLQTGTNTLGVTGVDHSGNPIAGDTNSVSVVYNSTNASPVGHVVINEIMSVPSLDNAQYVELYNNSPNTSFDLSGWQLQGVGYTFPNGSILNATNFLILAANRAAFANAYGATNPVFDTFSGTLSASGETLALIQPGTTNTIVAQVKYQNTLPWPTNAQGTGASLQLVDSRQDNWRVGNWRALSTNQPTAQWIYVTTTGTASSSLFYIYLQSAGDLYIDDMKLVAGSVPEVGANVLSDGDFESGFPSSWTVSANLSGSALSTQIRHSGNASLHLVSSSGGTTQGSSIWQNISPALTDQGTYTLSFWYLQSTNGGPLIVRLSGSGVIATVNPSPNAGFTIATPAQPNAFAATLTPFPTLWLNEVQADNLNGITNSAGQHVPWLELFNPGSNNVSLNGLYLANNYTNLVQWAFPSGATIGAGQFKVVFADGRTDLSTANELHANFVLPSGSGSVALTRFADGQQQVMDYMDYQNLRLNDSYGDYPDGQSFLRQEFFQATPGASNNGTAVPPSSFVAYTTPGAIYTQNFDTLPYQTASSVNADNPVTVNGVTYSLANPYDFAFPTVSSGGTGGMGLPAMAGWYGASGGSAQFGATAGDQTTGGDISFGMPNSSQRALGLLATSSTKGTAFGVRILNATGITLTRMNVQATGEVWRQSNLPKTLQFSYYVDPTGTNTFKLSSVTATIPALNVNIPTVAADTGGVAVDGTLPSNQTNLSVMNQVITNWPPGAALWLVWQMPDSTGKAQGLAIDNFSFSASVQAASPTIAVQATETNMMMAWPTTVGQTYQLEYKDSLTNSVWTPLGNPIIGSGDTLMFTNDFGSSTQGFFRLRLVN